MSDKMQEKLDAMEKSLKVFIEDEDERIKALDEKQSAQLKSFEEVKAEVEAMKRLHENKRFGIDGVDKVLAAIPEKQKRHLHFADVLSKQTRFVEQQPIFKDPVIATACALWMRAVAMLKTDPANVNYHRENMEKMEKALGENYIAKDAMQIGDPAEGGYIVPVPLEAQLLQLIQDSGIIRPMATVMPMTSYKHLIPSLDSNFTVYIVAEEGQISDSGPAAPLGQKALEAKKFCGLVTSSLELVQDNAIGLLVFLNKHLTSRIARLEDTEALEGDGTYFTGLSDDTGVNEIAAAGADGDAVSYTKIVDTKWEAAERTTRRNAYYIMHPKIAKKCERLVDDQSRPIWNMPFFNQLVPPGIVGPPADGFLNGFPMAAHSGIMTDRTKGGSSTLSNVYFGPFDNIILGDRTGITFGVSEHFKWDYVQLSIRVVKRTGIAVALPAAFTRTIDLETA